MANETGQITKNVAYATAENLTNDTDPNAIIKSRRESGSEDFGNKRAESTMQAGAEMAGLTEEEVGKLGPEVSNVTSKQDSAGDLVVGAERLYRWHRAQAQKHHRQRRGPPN